ncbi:MAG: hypothetical protein RI907_893 [Pseudomonadota bacterium]|jgi:hypothetical protein
MRAAHKTLIAAACLASGWAQAAVVKVASVKAVGSYTNAPALVTDGVFPTPASSVNSGTNVYWTGQEGSSGVVITMKFDQAYLLTGASYSLDNNDAYRIQVSKNGTIWYNLIRVESYDGEVSGGMDTFSTLPSSPYYVEDHSFAPLVASYARVFARGGDGTYAVGELQFYGTATVPEPEALALLLAGVGVAGTVARRRAAKA